MDIIACNVSNLCVVNFLRYIQEFSLEMSKLKRLTQQLTLKKKPLLELCSYFVFRTAAKDIDNLKRLGITHILNAAFVSSRTNCYDHGIVDTDPDWYSCREYNCEFLGIDAIDNPEFDLSQFFEDAADFIESARCSNGMLPIKYSQSS